MDTEVADQSQARAPVIAPARSEHLSAIAALAKIIWRTHYPGIISPAQIEYMLERMYAIDVMSEELVRGIAYDRLLVGSELKGFASYGPNGTAEVKLHKLYIHPDSQQCGFGTLLLRRVENVSRQNGARTLVLAVNKKNTKAIAAYQKNGFTIRESVVVDIGGGFVMDDYVMEKRL